MTKDTTLDAYALNFMPFYTEYQGPTKEFKDYKFEDTIYFRGKELQREKPATTSNSNSTNDRPVSYTHLDVYKRQAISGTLTNYRAKTNKDLSNQTINLR